MKMKLLTSFLFLIFVSTQVLAVRPSINDLKQRVNQLEAENIVQQAEIDTLQSDVGTLQIEVDTLEVAAAGSLKVTNGTFTSNNMNNRLIVTGIPGGSTLVEIIVVQLDNQLYSHWFKGMSNVLNGAGAISISPIATNRFIPSGVNFIVGTLSPNAGVGQTVQWTVFYE